MILGLNFGGRGVLFKGGVMEGGMCWVVVGKGLRDMRIEMNGFVDVMIEEMVDIGKMTVVRKNMGGLVNEFWNGF